MAKTLEQWHRQPYGIWTCADGRQVMFNRQYKPMWQRLPDGRVALADPSEWVHWQKQDWFYDDGTPTREVDSSIEGALRLWGLAPGSHTQLASVDEGKCIGCGCPLSREARELGREMCLMCYEHYKSSGVEHSF
jgi:hypothetical protein